MTVHLSSIRRYKQAKPARTFLATITVVDLLSDILLVASLLSSTDADFKILGKVGVSFLILPLLANGCATLSLAYRWQQASPSFSTWLTQHRTPGTAVLVLGFFNVELLTLMSSRLYHKLSLSAPLAAEQEHLAEALGMVKKKNRKKGERFSCRH